MPKGNKHGYNENGDGGHGKGRRPWGDAIFFVQYGDSAAEVTFVPTKEPYHGDTPDAPFVAYAKFEEVVKVLSDRISEDDGDPRSQFFKERGIKPTIRQLFNDAVEGEPVTVSLDESTYVPEVKAKGPKRAVVTEEVDVAAE